LGGMYGQNYTLRTRERWA